MDIMVDTSVWVDFFNDVDNPQVNYLVKLLQEGRVATCLVILMEVLQGIQADKACKKNGKLSFFARQLLDIRSAVY